MGLDMYLTRFPRYKGYTPEEIIALDDFLDLRDKKEKYTFEEWTGKDISVVPKGADRAYLEKFYKTRYAAWDDEHRHPHKSIHEDVAYWRKANAIHKWFVDRVQDGVDDCDYHREVTERDLKDLLDICETILANVILEKGKVINGYRTGDNWEWEPILQDGKIITNRQLCEKLLPCQDGFFFGNTQYDQWYLDSIRRTQQVLERILRETDFETQMIYYQSSW